MATTIVSGEFLDDFDVSDLGTHAVIFGFKKLYKSNQCVIAPYNALRYSILEDHILRMMFSIDALYLNVVAESLLTAGKVKSLRIATSGTKTIHKLRGIAYKRTFPQPTLPP